MYIESIDAEGRRKSYFVEVPDESTTIAPVIEVQLGVGACNAVVEVSSFVVKIE